MKRTYLPINQYPEYNNTLDHLLVNSTILNSENSQMELWDKHNIIFHLAELEGNENGEFVQNEQSKKAIIPLIRENIDSLKKKFELIKIQKVKQGFAIPSIMDRDMMQAFYTLHARLTCHEAEVEFLKKKLEEYIDEDQKEDDNLLLAYGLQGHGKLENNMLSRIDGQKVSELPNGLMVIDDPKSPYHGMSVPDYRELIKKYQADKKKANQEKLLRLQAEAKAKGERIPVQLPAQAPHRVSISSLPPFPSEYENHLIGKIQRIRKTI